MKTSKLSDPALDFAVAWATIFDEEQTATAPRKGGAEMTKFEELRTLLAAATPGEWTFEDRGYKYILNKPGDGYISRDILRLDGSTMAAFNQKANAKLIALSHNMLPALLEAVELLKELHEDFNFDNPRIDNLLAKLE